MKQILISLKAILIAVILDVLELILARATSTGVPLIDSSREGGEVGQDGSSDPDRVLPLGGSEGT